MVDYNELKEKVISSGLFDGTWYLSTYPDVAELDLDPLDHFVATGISEGRSPGPDFDSERYLILYEDVRNSGLPPFLHYISSGRAEGRSPSASSLSQTIVSSGLFDAEWYRARYSDVELSGLSPLEHFIRIGRLLHRDPGPSFNCAYYLETNRDV